MNNPTEDFTAIITVMIYQIKIQKPSLEKIDSPKAQDPTTVVPENKMSTPLEGRNSTKNGGIWNLKHEIT